MKRNVGDIAFDKFKNLIDEIKEYAELVYLHGAGEPLLHPRIIDLIQYCKSCGVRVALSTNATLLDKEMSRNILGAGIDYMILAVDGATKETFEKIRKNADYEQVCENIRVFLKEKERIASHNFTVMQMVVSDETKHEIKSFLTQWKKEERINAIRLKRLLDLRFLNETHNKPGICDKPCFFIWRQANIYWDGTASLCCMANDGEEVIGNVFEEGSFSKVWNSETMQRIRRLHSQGQWSKVPICTRCDMPQPSYAAIAGLTAFNAFKTRKILPAVENMSIVGDFT